jgi:hypothetical protein
MISQFVNRYAYSFCEGANYIIILNAILGLVSTLIFFKIKDKLLQLGFYFLAKLLKLGLSVICAIILLKSNICPKEPLYFFVLITYLLYLTFEITILLTNLRPVSRE